MEPGYDGAHFISSPLRRRRREADLCEWEASLVYIVSSSRHGGGNRRFTHIFEHKHEAERVIGKWLGAFHLKALP